MDIWDGAVDIVRQRMEDNRQLLTDPDPQIHYVTEPPVRTDDGGAAGVQVTERYAADGPRMSRAAMYDQPPAARREVGLRPHVCDPRYLQLGPPL